MVQKVEFIENPTFWRLRAHFGQKVEFIGNHTFWRLRAHFGQKVEFIENHTFWAVQEQSATYVVYPGTRWAKKLAK